MRHLRFAIALLIGALIVLASGPGFRSRMQFEEHFQKHGSEFGTVTKGQYLSLAQDLRDAPEQGRIGRHRPANRKPR